MINYINDKRKAVSGAKNGQIGLVSGLSVTVLAALTPVFDLRDNKSGFLPLSQQKGLSLPRDLIKSELSFDFGVKRRLRLYVGR